MIHPNKYLKDPILNRVVETMIPNLPRHTGDKVMTSKHSRESKEPDYEEDKDQLEEEQEEKTEELNEDN
jgi:hypothetical protein